MSNSSPNLTSRVIWLDGVRGIAIILMIAFHFCFDLRYFGYVDWSVPNGIYWYWVRCFIITLFVASAGCSIVLAYGGSSFSRRHFLKKQGQLLIAVLLVSAVSKILFEHSWIYFGILHFMWVAISVTVLLYRILKIPVWLLFIMGLANIIIYHLEVLPFYWPFIFFDKPIANFLPLVTEDFVPLFPWLGVMLVSVASAHYYFFRIKYKQNVHSDTVRGHSRGDFKWPSVLVLLGRNSLLIYLIHQPILFLGFGFLALF